MNSNVVAKGIYKAFVLIAATLLFIYILYLTKTIFAYIALAVVFALIGRPIAIFLRVRLKFPNTLAVSFTILLLFGLLIALVWLFIPLITEQGEKLALLDLKSMQKELDLFFAEITNSTSSHLNIVEDIIEDVNLENAVQEEIKTGFLPQLFNSIFEVLSTMSVGLFSTLFISFFLLKDTKTIQKSLVEVISINHRMKIIHSLDAIKELLSRYFIGLLVQIFILFIIYAITLTLVGIENALAIAFLCSIFNVIPYVGPIIGAVFMIVFSVTSNLGLDFENGIIPIIGYVAIGIIIGQLVDNLFSQPFVFSSSVRSHPLEIFLIIIISGLLFGVIGMIVAVPGYTVLKVIFGEFMPENRIVRILTRRM